MPAGGARLLAGPAGDGCYGVRGFPLTWATAALCFFISSFMSSWSSSRRLCTSFFSRCSLLSCSSSWGEKRHLPLCLLPPYTWPSPRGGGTHPGTQQGLPKKNPRGCRLILLAWGRGLPLGARPHRGTAHPEITYGCLGFGEVIDLKVEVFNLHLHGLAGLDGGRAGELGLLELRGHGSAPGLGARGHPQPLGGHTVGAASPDPPGS